MSAIIDLKSELLIDQSRIGNPYLKLLLAVLGKELVKGSAWVAINKKVASQFELLSPFIVGQTRQAAA
ncbi:MAG TPA: hypothetical protein VKB91_13380 [Gemmatimonadaceae bacterium]|nr:hypothetical protein [Gemmatimonadaceae bacterium]